MCYLATFLFLLASHMWNIRLVGDDYQIQKLSFRSSCEHLYVLLLAYFKHVVQSPLNMFFFLCPFLVPKPLTTYHSNRCPDYCYVR